MKQPFKIGMTADRVLELAKQQKMFRVAKNEIIALESTRYVIKWHFEACSLLIKFNFQNPPYRVFEIMEPLQTGKRLTPKQASLTPAEAKRRTKELKLEAKASQ